MNKRQKALLVESVTIIMVTAIAVVSMMHLKGWVSRSETIRAMEQLGQLAVKYRKEKGSVPSEYHIKNIKGNFEEHIGFGKLQYRARCIDFDSKPDEILAYVEKRHRATLLSDGYVVLQLDGNVQWMDKQEFKKLLSQQQKKSPEEMQMLQNN